MSYVIYNGKRLTFNGKYVIRASTGIGFMQIGSTFIVAENAGTGIGFMQVGSTFTVG